MRSGKCQVPSAECKISGQWRLLGVVAMLAMVSSLSACVGKLPPQGVDLLKGVDSAYRKGDYPATVSRADEFLAQYGDTEAAGEAYYLRGLAYAASKDRAHASADFESAIKSANRSDLTPLAHVAAGNLAFEDGKLTLAAQHYQPVVEQLPNESPKDIVLYRLGVCYSRQGRWQDGRTWFSQLTGAFPASSMEPLARRYLAVDGFTIQCGAYLDPANAQKQVRALRDQGAKDVRWVQDPRMKYHLVQVGSYATYREARDGLAQVMRSVPDAIIVP